jgi:meiotically up-regulated gene 157 (Mug157) protein
MLKQGFRPSDDANELPYNIPGNAYLCTYLQLVATKILSKMPK